MLGFAKDLRGYLIEAAAGDVRSYSINWEKLLAAGETVVAYSWTLPAGVANMAAGQTGATVSCQISTPTPGVYEVICHISTSTNEIYNRGFRIVVK